MMSRASHPSVVINAMPKVLFALGKKACCPTPTAAIVHTTTSAAMLTGPSRAITAIGV